MPDADQISPFARASPGPCAATGTPHARRCWSVTGWRLTARRPANLAAPDSLAREDQKTAWEEAGDPRTLNEEKGLRAEGRRKGMEEPAEASALPRDVRNHATPV